MIHILEIVMHTLESTMHILKFAMHILESAMHVLESVMHILGIYLYGLVASVIKKSGMLATKQNIIIGWGVPAFIILFNMCFEYENYGGTYHCWLQMDQGL